MKIETYLNENSSVLDFKYAHNKYWMKVGEVGAPFVDLVDFVELDKPPKSLVKKLIKLKFHNRLPVLIDEVYNECKRKQNHKREVEAGQKGMDYMKKMSRNMLFGGDVDTPGCGRYKKAIDLNLGDVVLNSKKIWMSITTLAKDLSNGSVRIVGQTEDTKYTFENVESTNLFEVKI